MGKKNGQIMKVFLDEKAQQVNCVDERFYTLDEKTYYPSVTTVLQSYPKGQYFEQWLRDTGNNSKTILREAGIKGTNVHNAIESFLKGGEVRLVNPDHSENYTLAEWQMINKFMDFWSYEGIDRDSLEIEELLFSKQMKLGGTGDLVISIDNENWFIDHKTSNMIHKTYRVQLAVYKRMWELQNPGRTIDRYGVLWLNAKTRTKKGFMQGKGWQINEFTQYYDHDMKLYGNVRAIWDEENPDYRPANKKYPNSFSLKAKKSAKRGS